jgi:hypothetical protein
VSYSVLGCVGLTVLVHFKSLVVCDINAMCLSLPPHLSTWSPLLYYTTPSSSDALFFSPSFDLTSTSLLSPCLTSDQVESRIYGGGRRFYSGAEGTGVRTHIYTVNHLPTLNIAPHRTAPHCNAVQCSAVQCSQDIDVFL